MTARRLFYDYYIFHSQRFGGVSRYFYELISRAAMDPRFETSLFQGFFINQYGIEKLHNRFASHFGLRRPAIHQLRHLFKPVNQFLFERSFRKGRPEVYHQTHFLDLKPDYEGRRILTVYDMTHEVFSKNFPAGDQTKEQKKAAVKKADHILAISESTKSDLVRLLGVAPEKVTVTLLANSLTHVGGASSLHTRPYFLFVGDRKGYKNFSLLLQAFSNSRARAQMDLICYGGGPLSVQEESEIATKKLVGNVFWRQGPDQQLATLYGHACALVYPSLYEGFGLPILEAYHYGCPVVTSKTSSIPEVAGEAALYFEKDQPEDLARVLDQVAEDLALRARLADRGREREKLFSWDRCYEQTASVYMDGL